MIKRLSIAAFFSVLLFGCFYDKEGELHPAGSHSFCDTLTPVTYSYQVRKIVDLYCMSCHYTGGVAHYDFTTWDDLNTSALNGFLMGCVTNANGYNPMPRTFKLSPCQIRTLQLWVNAGAPQN